MSWCCAAQEMDVWPFAQYPWHSALTLSDGSIDSGVCAQAFSTPAFTFHNAVIYAECMVVCKPVADINEQNGSENAAADGKRLLPVHADEPRQLSVYLIQSCYDVITERGGK